MWLGQADPLWRYAGLLPEYGRVFHHLPFDTRIRVREGRLKSSSKGTVPLTAGPGPLRPEEALKASD